jgi:hypothetical protein
MSRIYQVILYDFRDFYQFLRFLRSFLEFRRIFGVLTEVLTKWPPTAKSTPGVIVLSLPRQASPYCRSGPTEVLTKVTPTAISTLGVVVLPLPATRIIHIHAHWHLYTFVMSCSCRAITGDYFRIPCRSWQNYRRGFWRQKRKWWSLAPCDY